MEMKLKRKMNLKEVPGDIIVLIFSKLPFFNLPTCRMVCTEWNKLVLSCKFDPKTSSIFNLLLAQTSPSWNNLHCLDFDLNNSQVIALAASFTFDPSWSSRLTIINSCNGLLCCSHCLTYTNMEIICILNPMTNEYLKLPSNPIPKDNRNVIYHYGFGFSPNTKQYKIVRHSYLFHRHASSIEIFAFDDPTTTTTRQWTHVAFVPFALHLHGTYFNGALFWIGARQPQCFIFRFDLEHEKFEEFCLSSQPIRPGVASTYGFLGVFYDTLYLTITFVQPSFHYEVWKMEQDSSLWIKAFVVQLKKEDLSNPRYHRSYHLQLIKAYEDGKILCLGAGSELILYDPTTRKTQILSCQVPIKKYLLVYQIDSFRFDSLHKILGS